MFNAACNFTGYTTAPCGAACNGGGQALECMGGAGVGWPARFDTVSAAALSGAASNSMNMPLYVQRFESARYTPGQGETYTVLPYTASTISVATPAMWNAPPSGADLAATAASKGISVRAPAGLNVNGCGYKCLGASASPLPPSGFSAWSDMIYRSNAANAALWQSNF